MSANVPRRWLVLLIVALLAPWVIVYALATQRKTLATSSSAREDKASGLALRSKPGPWGELELVPISISPPAEFISELADTYERSTWHFADTKKDELARLFAQASLKPAETARFMACAKADPCINGFVLEPPAELVQPLRPEARRIIYGALTVNNKNMDQVNAYRLPVASFEPWLTGLAIRSQVKDLLRGLLYRNGKYYFFADLFLLEPKLEGPGEEAELLRGMANESSLVVRLLLNKDSDLRELSEYWGRGGRARDIYPLLESLAQAPTGRFLDVVHLLPSFARRRIYTYPHPSTDPNAVNMDCFWTALNFFQDAGEELPPNVEALKRKFNSEYFPIHATPELGDLVMFARKGDDLIHSAVYIADDILFTKNGSRSSSPWMFMKMEDMRDYYISDAPVKVRYFRRKEF